uniref:Peptidase M1 leukotriene A4 hydrolase/aminopeptidase C-terminal domain-containing protein n=1 Tax=Plectus sambesii TaxID=2011161 RepID=A0A914V0I3_9BILA
MNEGFTVFLSRKICGSLYSEPYRHFLSMTGWTNDLKPVVEEFGPEHEFTKLVQDHTNVDPCKAFSYLSGEKGSAFLFYLEQKLGGPEVFEKFLRSFVNNFKFKSITTDDFLEYLKKYFHHQEEALELIDFDHWLHDPGVPRMRPVFDHSMAKACADMRELWLHLDGETIAMISAEDYHSLAPQQKIEFLSLLLTEKSIPHFKLETMSTLYGLRSASNCEIFVNFVRLGIKSRWPPAIGLAVKLVSRQGRLNINRTVYRELAHWKPDIAIQTFQASRQYLHPIVDKLIEDDLALIG